MKLTTANKENLPKIKKLYRDAFPLRERKPFSFLLRKSRTGEGEIFAIESDGGKFLGIATTLKYKNMVMLDYFATAPEQRNGGIGSQALHMLLDRYSDMRFFGEIETTAKPHPELALRQRRKGFYLRNGLVPAGFSVLTLSCEFEVITTGKPFSFEEYKEFYYKVIGLPAFGRVKLMK